MSCRKACLIILAVAFSTAALAQVSPEQVQVAPPLLRAVDPPSPNATAADLEQQADRMRSEKLYLDALDYYHAALNRDPLT